MKDLAIGFLYGITFYPWPVAVVPGGAFNGWNEDKFLGWGLGLVAGVASVIVVGVVTLRVVL